MKNNNIILKGAILGLCVMISGCQSNPASGKTMVEAETVSEEVIPENGLDGFPGHIKETLSSGVIVDAEVDAPKISSDNAGVYQGTVFKADVEKLSSLLLNDSVTQNIIEQGQDDGTGKFYTCSDADGSTISSLDDEWVYFSTKNFSQIRTDFVEETVSNQSNLNFATPEEADQKIKEVFKALNIETYLSYQCIPMTYTKLKENNLAQYEGLEDVEELQEDINALKAIPWSEEYDCYCFTYYGTIDNYKLYSQDRDTGDDFVPGSILRVVYSKNGIQQLEISNIYIKQNEIENGTLCSIDEILQAIDQKYNSTIMQGDYKVTSMELEYMADILNDNSGYKLFPVWRCSINHQYETQDKESDQIVLAEDNADILINAISGAEVYCGDTI